MSGADTCTVTYGMSTSGMRDTGRSLMLTMPRTATTSTAIVTATGLSSSFFSISYFLRRTSEPSARVRFDDIMTLSPSESFAPLSLSGSTTNESRFEARMST